MTKIVDLDAWRCVCLAAYSNLPAGTDVTMAQVDAVLVAGAREAEPLDTATEAGATAYGLLVAEVSGATGVGRADVDAILTMCAEDAAPLIDAAPVPDESGGPTNQWRVILTDSEDLTGVAPVCPQAADPDGSHYQRELDAETWFDPHGVYDCCPGPHIEAWSTNYAERLVGLLNESEAEICA